MNKLKKIFAYFSVVLLMFTAVLGNGFIVEAEDFDNGEQTNNESFGEDQIFYAETDNLEIVISAENGAFAENTILSAVEITNQEAKEAVQDIIDEDVIDAVGVDLNFYLNDEEVQPVEGKQVTVQINLKQKLNKIDKSKTIVIHEHINTAIMKLKTK